MATVQPLFWFGQTIEVKHEKDFSWTRCVDARWLNRVGHDDHRGGAGLRVSRWGLRVGVIAVGVTAGGAWTLGRLRLAQ
jgi:hypothetical protein